MSDTTTELPPPSPPTGPPDGRPPLVRRRRGRMLAGVAIGLARHLRVDVTLVRIAFVILAFTGGAGILGYIAGWVLLPEEDDDTSEPAVWTVQRGAPFWIGVGLLVLAAIALVEHTTPFGSFGTPLVLIAVGAALWKVSQDRAERSTVPPGTPAAPPAEAGPADPPANASAGTTQPVPVWTPLPVPRRGARRPPGTEWSPPPPRPRSVLGRVTVALVLLAVGGGALLDEMDLVSFTALDAVATALLLTGLGLVVGTWFGRAHGLIGLGVVLVPVVIATSFVHGTGIDLRDGAGERIHHVTASTGIEPVYSLGAGVLEIDLSGAELPPGDTRTGVRLGAGEVLLLVPEDTSIEIDARVQLGAISLPQSDRAGPGLTERLVLGSRDGAGGTLHVDVELGVGELVVRIVPTPEDLP